MVSGARRPSWIVVALVAAMTAAVLVVAIGPGLSVVQTSLYDNRPSGVACENLPTRAEVEADLTEHAGLVRRLEALDPGAVEVMVSEPCDDHPGAAEILVTYPGGDLRERIEQLLVGESFGVPTSLRNV